MLERLRRSSKTVDKTTIPQRVCSTRKRLECRKALSDGNVNRRVFAEPYILYSRLEHVMEDRKNKQERWREVNRVPVKVF
jgi:hypothetical protein